MCLRLCVRARRQTIIVVLDVIRGAGQRYPDIGSELNSLYSNVQRNGQNISSLVGPLGHNNAPYDVCANVLDEVKSVILNLVKMLEVWRVDRRMEKD